MNLVKKAKIDNKIIDVVPFETFMRNADDVQNNYVGVEKDGIVYPARGKNDTRPGIYNNGVIFRFVPPDRDQIDDYSSKNIIDFNNSSSIKEVISKQNKLRGMESSILTTVDNIFVPNIDQSDSPEMVALKKAVIAKHIDLDKYEQRFGSNFNNDRRLFDKNSITLVKLKTIADALDMKVTLSIEDKDDNVPNPIGSKIVVEINCDDEAL